MNSSAEYENARVREPRLFLKGNDAVTAHPKPTPLAVRHATNVSLCHRDVRHDDAPIRTPPLQSKIPERVPYTDTLICAVVGRTEGDTPLTIRRFTISGKRIPPCVCSGRFLSLNVEILTLAAATAALEFTNPATVQITAAVGDKGVTAVDRFRANSPNVETKATDAVTSDGPTFVQRAGASEELSDANRTPEMRKKSKAVDMRLGAGTKEMVNVTLAEFVT